MKTTFLALFVTLTYWVMGQGLPKSTNLENQIIHHTAYTLSYNESHEQADWVTYRVTKIELENDVAKRKDNFTVDTCIVTGSAQLLDYKNSGYDKGHLAPAATFVDNQKEMDESFLMSNMSPQNPSFNRGVWKRLEDYERKMAIEKDTVYVICGPVLTEGLKTIGPNKVSIPKLYFKIIYYKDWMVCFILSNRKSNEPLYTFEKSLGVVEKITKIDFFVE